MPSTIPSKAHQHAPPQLLDFQFVLFSFPQTWTKKSAAFFREIFGIGPKWLFSNVPILPSVRAESQEESVPVRGFPANSTVAPGYRVGKPSQNLRQALDPASLGKSSKVLTPRKMNGWNLRVFTPGILENHLNQSIIFRFKLLIFGGYTLWNHRCKESRLKFFKYPHFISHLPRKGIWKTRKNDIWKGEELLPSIFLQPTSIRCSHQWKSTPGSFRHVSIIYNNLRPLPWNYQLRPENVWAWKLSRFLSVGRCEIDVGFKDHVNKNPKPQ